MDTLAVMTGLDEAARLLSAKCGEVASGSLPVWKMVNNARRHVESQLSNMLRAE
jgi:hypothetical protein